MRQCPQCNYIDNPIWRHKRFRLFTCYCRLDELKDADTTLYKALLDGNIQAKRQVKIGFYIYHLTKAGYVDRIHYLDSLDGKSWREPDQEKALCRFRVKGQQVLAGRTNQ